MFLPIVYLLESIWSSVLIDSISFGVLTFSFIFNYIFTKQFIHLYFKKFRGKYILMRSLFNNYWWLSKFLIVCCATIFLKNFQIFFLELFARSFALQLCYRTGGVFSDPDREGNLRIERSMIIQLRGEFENWTFNREGNLYRKFP